MKRIGVALVVLLAAGCSTVESKDIRTSGITANYVVTLPETSDVAEVRASLRVGTLTFVELGDGEKITVSGGGKDVVLKHHRAAGVTDYSNRLDGVVAAGTEVTFSLERAGDDRSAPRSTVKLPERVRLVAPRAGTTYSRRSAIAVRFDSAPSHLPATITWTGQCIQSGSLRIEPGRTAVTIPRGSVKQLTTTPTPGRDPDRCPVRLTVSRRTEGTLDAAFKDGSLVAQSESTREISSAP